jgi:hypothetical protein
MVNGNVVAIYISRIAGGKNGRGGDCGSNRRCCLAETVIRQGMVALTAARKEAGK